jgi:glycosyltransferase involved in cell wall biosynthesis
MATYRRTHCLAETVRQLLDAQTRPPHELIVVNNDAAPGAEAAVRAVLPADPRLRVVTCATGKQGASRNLGLTLATGEYVAFVDDDDDYAPTYVEALAGALDLGIRSVRAQIQTCGMASPDCTGRPTVAHHPLTPNTMARRDALTPTWGEPPSEDRDYWERHPVEGAIDDCLVFTCRGPGQHSPRNAAQGGSWRVRFVISALVTRDDAKALPGFIDALRQQTYANFRAVLVDATGEDKLRRTFERLEADDARFAVVRSDDVREHALSRLLRAGDLVTMGDDDVLLPLRTNERLAHAGVLNRLAHVYGEHAEVWATFGGCATDPFVPAWPRAAFPPAVYQTRGFRHFPGVIGEYAPLTLRAALAAALAAQLAPESLDAAATATRADDDADLPLFLAVLEAAGPSHVYPMADVHVVKQIDRPAYQSATARQAALARQFEVRSRPAITGMTHLTPVNSTDVASAPLVLSASPVERRSTAAVVWHGPVYDPSGYGNELRQFVLSLDEAGTRVPLRAAGNHSDRFKATAGAHLRDRLDVLLAEATPRDFTGVLHLPPAFLQRLSGTQYMIARTMFETDGLPAPFVARCNQMDELWIPSAFNVDTFRRAGVRAHLVQVPGAIDSERFRPGHAPLTLGAVHGTVFLSAIEWKTRKGWETLLDAWAEAFDAGDDVTLVLRASVPGHTEADSAPEIWRQIEAHLAKSGRTRADLATIVVLGRALANDDIPRLYAAAHAYVAATSGEGWGYPYMEAMASGLPTIATRWSGHLEFMHDENSLLCDVERLVPALDPYVGDVMHGQRWALPSARHLAQLLRSVVDEPTRVRQLAQRAREDMSTIWTWQRTAAVVQERLVELAASGNGSTRIVAAPSAPPERTRDNVVRWEGPQFTHASLGLVNREVCAQLLGQHGIELLVRPTQSHDFTPQADSPLAPLHERMHRVSAVPAPRAAVHVAHQWPPSFDAPDEGAWVLMQPWEYGGLPSEWIPVIRDQVDEYWVYCSWQRECAIESGVPAEKIAIVPLGVDPSRYRPDGARYPLATRKRTKLLAVGGIIPRKGMDLLVDAYLRTFTADDDVCLVIKGLSARWAYHGNSGQSDFAALPALAAAEGAAEIEFIGDTLNDDEVASLYRACDVFVAPFRGEGFGLPIAEAMASELPVIVTHAGPVFDLCDDDTAYLVPAGQSTVSSAMAGAEPGRLGFWWADPDVQELGRLMQHAVAHPEEARAMGQRARERVLAHFTHAHTARVVANRVRVLAARPTLRDQAPAAFNAQTAPFPLDQPRGVVFFHQATWHRDDWHTVVRRYLATFDQQDDVSLVLAHDPAQGVDEAHIANLIGTLREAVGRAEHDAPDILLVPGELDEAMLASLYSAADCVIPAQRDAAAAARAAAVGVTVLSALDEFRVVYEHAHRALVADAHVVA